MIRIPAILFQLGYSLMLIGVGVAGIFYAPWELISIFKLDANWLQSSEAVTFLNQYRFLKAVEVGFGLFCLFYRREILDGGISSVLFLSGCMLGIFARSWSWYYDGRPSDMLITFLVLESITFVLVWAYARRKER
ncbi:MAG: DUF4345 family protein [Gammaproteobacteria bacterium]